MLFAFFSLRYILICILATRSFGKNRAYYIRIFTIIAQDLVT